MNAIPMAVPVGTPLPAAPVQPDRFDAAAGILERATQGTSDPAVTYMLAMAYKRQGKNNEARAALRKIPKPDPNVFLQLALISIDEEKLPQAEEELARGWSIEQTSYEVCYNLLLIRLTLGKIDACLELMPKALELVEQRQGPEERRFLYVMYSLLRVCQQKDSSHRPDMVLSELTANDEQRMLQVVRSLGQLDTVHMLLKALSDARPRSTAVREAYIEAVLVKGKYLIDRCQWTEAELLLRQFVRDRSFSRNSQVALLTLLGCCAALTQDFDTALTHFNAALKLAPNDARLHQNMAITYELQGDLSQADPHWNRFFDLFTGKVLGPPEMPYYRDALLFECLARLATKYSDKEKWNSALNYMQRASQLRPNDTDAMERLFHLYGNAKRQQDARRTLERLRKLKPNEPRYELYELDLVEVKGLNDIERLLTEIDRISRRYPDDHGVRERAVSMVGNVVPLIGNLCDQLTDQLGKVVDQVRNLPNYQINWAAVREVMRDLMKEFQKLRRILGKCSPLVQSDEHKRIIRDLSDHIDKKIDACRSMGA
jgi:Flp pilus assembly protein TadD